MAVDPSSAGGYIYALGEFLDHGIRRRDFAEITFAPGPGGKQEKVVLAVFAGTCDLGSVRDGALNILAGKIEKAVKVQGIAVTKGAKAAIEAAGGSIAA